MMMMSAPSSSFHDYLPMDSYCLPKIEAMTPIQTTNEHLEDTLEKNPNRTSVVKRPMNAFLLWARGERKRVSSDGYGVSQTSLSKFLGETWRHMSMEEKQPFLDMAETLKRQHHLDHPDYKFKPKQRSTNGNKNNIKKTSSYTPQRQVSTLLPSPPHCTSSSSSSSSSTLYSSQSSTSNITPLPVQSNVLAMCQAIIPSSSETNDDWFEQLTGQPQSVILAPSPRLQTSPTSSSRRAVRIQIINKHDDIVLPPPTLLPMTPPPPSSSALVSQESTPPLSDYFGNHCNMFYIPTSHHHHHHHQVLAPVLDDQNEYETFHESSVNHLTDLDQQYDSNGWIDTPLSNFGTNSTDMVSSSPYSSYDFLCL